MKKILLVEDDSHLQFLIKEELADEGYDVSVVSNGKEALSRLFDEGEAEPDLIILDIRMPKMDGLDTMGYILKSKLDKPVIIHSAYASYRDNPIARTADAYVLKSHNFSRLKATISELISSRNDDLALTQQAANC
ncbi:MAG TPA: response regulator [Deltaproteobacteria bacterium]|jgi:DNA-binding response OmpR family regulator|nr:response regulator [Deltaproteobacteria bacterium]HQI00238.1 response regulator [Deltaproteobacteria bacterium]